MGQQPAPQSIADGKRHMSPNQEESLAKIRRDHDYMLLLIERIMGECDQTGVLKNCNDCQPTRRHVCHGNIEQLIRSFIEATLKHNFMESMYMEHFVPEAHRIAHNRAHMEIAQQLTEIRVVFSEVGNCVMAIDGMDRVRQTLLGHFKDYDHQLEAYLAVAETKT